MLPCKNPNCMNHKNEWNYMLLFFCFFNITLVRRTGGLRLCGWSWEDREGHLSVSCLTFWHRLKSNNQKAFEVKWVVTVNSNLLEIKSINHIVLHLVLFYIQLSSVSVWRSNRERGLQLKRVREREKMLGGAEEKPSILIMENRSSLLIRATAFYHSTNAE